MSNNDFAWVEYLELFPLAMAYHMQFLIKSCGQGRDIISCFLSYDLFMGTYLPTKEPWFHANTSSKSPKASVEKLFSCSTKKKYLQIVVEINFLCLADKVWELPAILFFQLIWEICVRYLIESTSSFWCKKYLKDS